MIEYTYNEADRKFYEAAWDILVSEAGALPDDKESFVFAFTRVEHPEVEYRFCGLLGFGGKFWRYDSRFYVTCYSEDKTKKREKIIASVNAKLLVLQAEFNPSTAGL